MPSPSLRQERAFALIAPLAAIVAYFPVVVVPYGFMDDYYVLAWRRGLQGHFFDTAASFGRPLHAVVLSGLFSLAPGIDSLRFVRLVSLLGVIVLAVVLYFALRQAGLGRWLSTAVCVSVVTLASFQIYVAWAAIAEAAYVAALAGLAALRLRAVPDLEGRPALVRRAESAAVLLCALLTYQPAAMFFWVFTAIDVLRPGQRLADAARRFAEALAVAAVALFFSYAAVRIGTHFWGGALASRTNLVDDPVGKLRWFWNEPIVNGLAMFDVNASAGASLALGIVAAVGIVLLHADSGRCAFGFLGLAAAFVPLTYLPNLAIAEDFASYRSIGALAALLALYVWLGLWGIARARTIASAETPAARLLAVALALLLSFVVVATIILPLSRPASRIAVHTVMDWPALAVFLSLFAVIAAVALWGRPPLTLATVVAAGVALALAAVVIAARNVTTLVVKPQSAELRMLRSVLEDPRAPEPQHIVFVKPNGTQGAAPLVRYDEFGPPSTYFSWVPDPVVALLSDERVHRVAPKLEGIYASDEAPPPEPGTVYVDMRKLRDHRVGWSVWTLHPAS